MQGAEYDRDLGAINLSQSLGSMLPNVVLRWVQRDKKALAEMQEQLIQIPLYLTKDRRFLVTSLNIPTQGVPKYVWYQRGVAFFGWYNE